MNVKINCVDVFQVLVCLPANKRRFIGDSDAEHLARETNRRTSTSSDTSDEVTSSEVSSRTTPTPDNTLTESSTTSANDCDSDSGSLYSSSDGYHTSTSSTLGKSNTDSCFLSCSDTSLSSTSTLSVSPSLYYYALCSADNEAKKRKVSENVLPTSTDVTSASIKRSLTHSTIPNQNAEILRMLLSSSDTTSSKHQNVPSQPIIVPASDIFNDSDVVILDDEPPVKKIKVFTKKKEVNAKKDAIKTKVAEVSVEVNEPVVEEVSRTQSKDKNRNRRVSESKRFERRSKGSRIKLSSNDSFGSEDSCDSEDSYNSNYSENSYDSFEYYDSDDSYYDCYQSKNRRRCNRSRSPSLLRSNEERKRSNRKSSRSQSRSLESPLQQTPSDRLRTPSERQPTPFEPRIQRTPFERQSTPFEPRIQRTPSERQRTSFESRRQRTPFDDHNRSLSHQSYPSKVSRSETTLKAYNEPELSSKHKERYVPRLRKLPVRQLSGNLKSKKFANSLTSNLSNGGHKPLSDSVSDEQFMSSTLQVFPDYNILPPLLLEKKRVCRQCSREITVVCRTVERGLICQFGRRCGYIHPYCSCTKRDCWMDHTTASKYCCVCFSSGLNRSNMSYATAK